MPKHILLIISDQCRADAIGAYGNEYAQTPALDALAADSTVYTSAITPSPVCVPARLCLLSGQYANRTGNSNNNPNLMYEGEGVYSEITKSGFDSCCVGKMHHVWDRYGSLGYKSRHTQEELSDPNDDYTNFILNSPYRHVFDYNGMRSEMYYVPQVSQLPAEAHPTQWIGDRSVEYLDSCDPENPVFLTSSFIHPHPPFCPPAPWNKLFRTEDLPAPFIPEETPDLKPLLHTSFDTDVRLGLSDKDLLRLKNFYYASLSFVDYQVGRIIAKLKEKGMYDDTLILFVSDHGECLGDYRNMGKRTMLSSASRIPFMMKVPGKEPGYCDDAVSLVDIAPTLLSYLGIEYDKSEYDGIDILNDKHEFVYSQYDCGKKGVYMCASNHDKLIYHAGSGKYYYFDELPEHENKYEQGGERVELMKPLLDAYVASDRGTLPEKPKGNGKPKPKYDFFGVGRMDHMYRRAEEEARIPEGYHIDLRSKEKKTPW